MYSQIKITVRERSKICLKQSQKTRPLFDTARRLFFKKTLKYKIIFYILILFILSGCVSSITIKRTVPARFHISGINRIVFTPFEYEATYHENGSNIIPEILEDSLRENGFFDVVAMPAINLQMDEKLSKSEILKIGRSSKTDAVITGKVMAFQVTHSRKETPVEKETPEGKVKFYETSMEKLGEVSFYADLYDTRTGKHLDHKYFTRIGSEKATGLEEIEKMSNDDKLLRGVTEKLAHKVVQSFTPHQIKQKLYFDNVKPCKEGVKAAKKGNWEAAQKEWRFILSSDPTSGCAAYNMALSYEVKNDYPQALTFHKKAVGINPENELYIRGERRVNRMISAEKILKRQLKGRK